MCLHPYLCVVWAGGSTDVVGRTLTGACALQPSFRSSYCTALVLSLGGGSGTNTMGGHRKESDPSPCLLSNWRGKGSQGNRSLKLKVGSIIIKGLII